MKSYTNNLYIEINNKEFEIEITASIENDSLGSLEIWGHKTYDCQPDYLGQIEKFTVLGRATREELLQIEKYIYDNESDLIEELSDKWLDN